MKEREWLTEVVNDVSRFEKEYYKLLVFLEIGDGFSFLEEISTNNLLSEEVIRGRADFLNWDIVAQH